MQRREQQECCGLIEGRQANEETLVTIKYMGRSVSKIESYRAKLDTIEL